MPKETLGALLVLSAIFLSVSAIIAGIAILYGFAGACIVGGSLVLVLTIFFLWLCNK